jgi:hypothetical protein
MPYADPAKRKAYAKNYYSQPEAKAKAAAHRAANRKENAARQRDYYNNNKDKCLATARNSERKRLYGITTEEMVALFEGQGSCCAVCQTQKVRSQKGWHIDHCHSSNKVRGILCHHCNVALGMAQDKVTTLRSAIRYLNKHSNPRR